MKKYSKYFVVAMSALAFAFSTGTLLKVNATPATSAAVPAQPVDLTYAAEKSLPSVVHILSTKNSKVQTVEVESDPFSDFFSDPFGFFGNPQGNGGKQKRSVRTPKQQGSGSGVIISTDGYIVTNNHVVADADELTVTLNDNKEYSARIMAPTRRLTWRSSRSTARTCRLSPSLTATTSRWANGCSPWATHSTLPTPLRRAS